MKEGNLVFDINGEFITEITREWFYTGEKSYKGSGSGSSQQNVPQQSPDVGPDGFMNIPDGIEEELPFS